MHSVIYVFSFTLFGHLCTSTGRYAYMVILWKCIVALPAIMGVWTDTTVNAFHVDTNDDIRLGETDKDMGDNLNSLLGSNNTNTESIKCTNTNSNKVYVRCCFN